MLEYRKEVGDVMVMKIYKFVCPLAIIINVGIIFYFSYRLAVSTIITYPYSEGLYAVASLLGLIIFLV